MVREGATSGAYDHPIHTHIVHFILLAGSDFCWWPAKCWPPFCWPTFLQEQGLTLVIKFSVATAGTGGPSFMVIRQGRPLFMVAGGL
jgi:hypothetical protein